MSITLCFFAEFIFFWFSFNLVNWIEGPLSVCHMAAHRLQLVLDAWNHNPNLIPSSWALLCNTVITTLTFNYFKSSIWLS